MFINDPAKKNILRFSAHSAVPLRYRIRNIGNTPVNYKQTMKILAIWLCLCGLSLASEGYVTLTSADGRKTMQAKPVAVVGTSLIKIRLEKENGEQILVAPEKFANTDRKMLSDWAVAMQKHPHQVLVNRVKRAKKLRVLFIGNSYSFKIPQQFKKLAQAEGHKLEVAQETKGGWTLAKHAASRQTLDRIAKGKWDIVVLQEQSQLPSFGESQRQQKMYPAAKSLAAAIREAGAIPVFFLTWGRKDGDQQNLKSFPNDTYTAMQERLTQGYDRAANQAGEAWVVPVGKVWATLRAEKRDHYLYANDGSHPSAGGNYLGACVFYTTFYDAEVDNPSNQVPGAAKLAQAAATARLEPLPYPLP